MRKHKNSSSAAKKMTRSFEGHFDLLQTIKPTPERLAKPDYEKDARGLPRKARTVQSLHNCHEISGDAVTAANWWLTDYIFAREGYGDWLREVFPAGYLKGDVHTFAMHRGQAGARIERIREGLTDQAHEMLVMLLAQGLSFTAIAEKKYPNKYFEQGKRLVRGQAALVLEQLAVYYAGNKHNQTTTQKGT